MCRVGVGWTAVPADGHCDMQLRHEQPRQLCLCRHAAVGPRHSHASELRVCVLGRRSAHSEPLGSCCAPVAQDEAVRQQCQCCCNVETMLATAVARGCGPAALIRTREARSSYSLRLRSSCVSGTIPCLWAHPCRGRVQLSPRSLKAGPSAGPEPLPCTRQRA